MNKTFMEHCFEGSVSCLEITRFVKEWHESAAEGSLASYLGLSEEEYSKWVENPDSLQEIVLSKIKAREDERLRRFNVNPAVPIQGKISVGPNAPCPCGKINPYTGKVAKFKKCCQSARD